MSSARSKIIKLSLFVIIIMTGQNAFQTIITKVYEEEGYPAIGPMNFAIFYSVVLVITSVISKITISQKWLITFAMFGYLANYILSIFIIDAAPAMKYILAAAGSVLSGTASSFLFTCVGPYIHNVCVFHGIISEKGHYNGLFVGFYSTSALTGGLVVTFGLNALSHKMYFIILSGICIVAFLFAFFFVQDVKRDQQIQAQMRKKSIREAFIQTMKFYPKMRHILGYIFIDGINLAVMYTVLTHFNRESDTRKSQLYAGLLVLFLGIGQIIGGYFGAKFCDFMKLRKTVVIGILLYMITCLMSFGISLLNILPLSCFICCCWGVVTNYVQANELVLCSQIYEGKTESYVIVRHFHSISLIFYEIFAILTKNSVELKYIMPVLFLFGFPALLLLRNLENDSNEKARNYTLLTD